MAVVRAVPGVLQLPTLAFSYYAVDDHLIVDAAFGRNPRKILENLREAGYRPSDISTIVVTHSHPDHMGGLAALKEASGARVVALEAEAPYIEGTRSLPSRGVLGKMLSPLMRSRPAHVDQLVREGDRVGPFQVVAAPGHTPGHLALFDPGRSLVIAGDAVRVGPEYVGPSPARMNVDHAQAIESFRKIARMEFENLVAGHQDVVTGGASARLRRSPLFAP